MDVQHPIPQELADVIAQRFRLIGDPTRIRLLDRLRGGEASAQELIEAIGGTQQNVSKHLSLLAEAGIVARRKEGTRVFYAIADESIFDLCEQVCGSLQQQLSELSKLIEGATR